MEWFSLFLNAITTIATICLACAAFMGLHAWKAQAVGTRKIALYEDMLVMFYEAEEKIADTRNPRQSYHEISEAVQYIKELGVGGAHKRNACNATLIVSLLRCERQSDFWRQFRAKRLRLKAIGDKQLISAMDDINKVRQELWNSVGVLRDTYFIESNNSEKIESFDEDLNSDPHYSNVFWKNDPRLIDDLKDSKLDELSKKVKCAVRDAEQICGRGELDAEKRRHARRRRVCGRGL